MIRWKLNGKAIAQRTKVTLGITGLSPPRVHIDGEVWHLDVGSSHPGAVVGPKGWAVPKLAMGVCPLEPRHANGDNSVLEISTGYFFSDCHGLAKTLSCIYQRGTLHIPLWNPLLI